MKNQKYFLKVSKKRSHSLILGRHQCHNPILNVQYWLGFGRSVNKEIVSSGQRLVLLKVRKWNVPVAREFLDSLGNFSDYRG
jgi:hypothetical protein